MIASEMTIILADDDDGHATLIQRNLERSGICNNFLRVSDGQQALDLMYAEGDYKGRKLGENFLLILDLKMPKVDGVEVLRKLKSDTRTASLPIIMLTTTDDPREVERCYELGCNVYITKPVAYDAFIEAVRRLGLFLQVVKLPYVRL